MALFNKEPDRNARPQQPVKPPIAPLQSVSPPATGAEAANPRPGTVAAQNLSAPEGRTYLDKGCKISGKLAFDGPTRIDGQVDGEITASDLVMIGEGAVVTAQIKAGSVVIAGRVSGDVVSSSRIEIRPSAKVLGNLTAPILVVHEGAVFEGHCAMQPEGGREDRKVTVFPKEERMAQAAGQKPA